MTKLQKLHEGRAIMEQILRALQKIEALKLNQKEFNLVPWHLEDSKFSVQALRGAFVVYIVGGSRK